MERERISVGLHPVVLKRLDDLCAEKGLKRPAVVAEAINKLWKEEHADEK
ncbi:MAG: hypothetical protein K2K53_08340 [Oscillospiraceae bacterium]|nr:hypothetical protein [Oscillospiraceae bacterium]